jgi:hypothetical protein
MKEGTPKQIGLPPRNCAKHTTKEKEYSLHPLGMKQYTTLEARKSNGLNRITQIGHD